jgi:hypothetical protein
MSTPYIVLIVFGVVMLLGGMVAYALSMSSESLRARSELLAMSDKQLHEMEARLAIAHLRGEMSDATYADLRVQLDDEVDLRREQAEARARFEKAKLARSIVVIGDEVD